MGLTLRSNVQKSQLGNENKGQLLLGYSFTGLATSAC